MKIYGERLHYNKIRANILPHHIYVNIPKNFCIILFFEKNQSIDDF